MYRQADIKHGFEVHFLKKADELAFFFHLAFIVCKCKAFQHWVLLRYKHLFNYFFISMIVTRINMIKIGICRKK